MRRTTLILIIVLAVVLLGGAGYLWWQRDSIVWPWNATSTTSTTNTSTTTNTTTNAAVVTNTTLPTEIKGDTDVTGTLTVGTVTVHISSQQKTDANNGQTADSGKTYLLVYFDALPSADVLAADQGLRSVVVKSGTATYNLESLKVASTAINGDRGYLQFTIPDAATNLKLVLGDQSVDLK